jgi:hypothetical protein
MSFTREVSPSDHVADQCPWELPHRAPAYVAETPAQEPARLDRGNQLVVHGPDDEKAEVNEQAHRSWHTGHGIPARAPSRGQSLTGSDARWRGGEALCICSTTADRILSSVIDGPAICAICWPRPRPSEPHAQVEPRHEIRVQVDVAAANPHVLSEGHQIEEELGRQGDPRGHGIVDPDPDGDQE